MCVCVSVCLSVRQLLQLLQIIITSYHQLVDLWWIYGKQAYFNMVWYWNEFCNIWYTCFSWCSLIFNTHHNFAKLFLKVHFVIQCFSWSQLFSEIHRNKYIIALATSTLRISFCWTSVWFSELKVAAHLWRQWTEGGSTCLWTQWNFLLLLLQVLVYF